MRPRSAKRKPAAPDPAPAKHTSKPLTDAERATLRRMLAEQSLHDFVKQAWHVVEPEERFFDNWHIQAICSHLEAVTAGTIPQLIINVPPGTMKSLLCGVFWPAWVWATQPGKRFMYSSYAEALAMRDSVKCRDLVTSEWYQERWSLSLKEDQNTKGRFDNDDQGWRIVGSISGKGIGEHPDFNVADDPHNVLQAESEADRMNVTHWFEGVFCVRGQIRNAKRVLIMQRLHALDCCGLAMSKGEWGTLVLPMKFESHDHPTATTKAHPSPLGFVDPRSADGELLWPSKYTEKKVANMEVNMGLYGAAGQLQQRPSPRGGGKFKRSWFNILPALPAITSFLRYWDKAGTQGGRGARTATCLMGKYVDDREVLAARRIKYIIIHTEGFREEAAAREMIIKQKAQTDAQLYNYVETWVEQEPGSGGKESAQGTVANLAGFACYMDRVTGAKEVRCDPLATAASVGLVSLLVGDWNEEYLSEIEMFPLGKLKDLVDASGGSFNKLTAGSGAFDDEALKGAAAGSSGDDGLDFPDLDTTGF